jgi:hypothetical protein
LNTLANDHTHCATCGSRLKDVETPPSTVTVNVPPPDHPGHGALLATNQLVGYQYPTEHAMTGERTQAVGPHELATTGLICAECGATDAQAAFDELRDISLLEYLQSILDSLTTPSKRDEHESTIDQREAFRVVIATGDLELALGLARG